MFSVVNFVKNNIYGARMWLFASTSLPTMLVYTHASLFLFETGRKITSESIAMHKSFIQVKKKVFVYSYVL